tara:strand:+ start:216 stop:641 length:426 start_codon:yes stop_codon:yes gene_type:complete
VQASFESPDIVASIKNQLRNGGIDFIIAKIINKVRIELKVLVLIFLFNISKFFIPENSILMKCNPKVPKINGNKKLIKSGKKDVIFIVKKEFKNTSNRDIKNKKDPVYKYMLKFCLSGLKKFNLSILFFFNCYFFIVPIHQ